MRRRAVRRPSGVDLDSGREFRWDFEPSGADLRTRAREAVTGGSRLGIVD